MRGRSLQFKEKIQKIAKTNDSRLILALDFPFQNPQNRQALLLKAEMILEEVYPYICAVKINNHLLLPLGLFDGVVQLIEKIHQKNLVAIMDAKVNDIGNTNQVICEYYFAAGFDAIIVNPFIGWEDGLKPIMEVSKRLARGVILLTYMSHKGAIEGYGQTIIDPVTGAKVPQYMSFANKALKWAVDGVVVGATVSDRIKEVHALLGDEVPIYSPGVGAQGGSAEVALKAGCSYLIVGREIASAENPAQAARKLRDSIKKV